MNLALHRARKPSVPTYRITTARKSVPDDQAVRVRGYVISMSIRIVCFLLAVVTTGWLRWTFVVGALLIPYFAVVFANGGREPNDDPPDTLGTFSDRVGGADAPSLPAHSGDRPPDSSKE